MKNPFSGQLFLVDMPAGIKIILSFTAFNPLVLQ
jgi:hypothetical protein